MKRPLFARIFQLFGTLLFLFGSLTPVVAAAMVTGDTAVVATERLNLRSGPGTQNGVVLEMPEGTQVQILEVEDGWAWVELKDDSSVRGWTSAKFLNVVGSGAPTDAESFFNYVNSRYGEPRGQGSIAELGVHYAYFCNNGFGVALFRESSSEPVLWEREEWCVSGVEPRDVDQNGTTEIVYYVSGGGSGVFATVEKHVSWPRDMNQPSLGFEYRTLQTEEYFDQTFEVPVAKMVVREMQYGKNCRADKFCPLWPEGAQCRPALACDIMQEGTLEVIGDVFPERLRTDPEWLEYVKSLASEGIVLVGDDVPADLADLSFESLDTIDSGERPELTEERKTKVEEWLNQ